jgi:hypothetical protein
MKSLFASAVLALSMLAASANAAVISQFSRTTNDGVFTLSAAQAAFLGVPTADRLGFFRVRSGGSPNVSWSAGDTFDATSVMNSVQSNGAAILGIFNGANAGLVYTGSAWSALGTTTFVSDSASNGSLFRAVAFAFNSASGNIVFRGSTTFNGDQTRGASPSPIPVPAALPLMLLALGGLGLVARRRRAA